MINKILLLSAIILVGVWLLFSDSTQQISSNISDVPFSSKHDKKVLNNVKLDSNIKDTADIFTIEASNKGDDYIVECSPEQTTDNKKFDEYYESAKTFLESLSDSNMKDTKLIYTLFAEPPEGETRFDLLIKFNDMFPDNFLILHEILRECTNPNYNKECNEEFIETAVASDKDNGAMWLNLLFIYASRGDDEGMVNTVRELDKSTFFDNGFVKRVTLYSESLEDSPANNFQLNMAIASGEEAMRLPAYSRTIQWCKENKNNVVEADICLQLGNYMEKRSKILIDQMIGIALKKIIFEAQGKSKLFEVADLEHKNIREYLASEQMMKASSLMMADEKLFRSWLNNFENYGEIKASKLLIEEAVSLSKSDSYFPCDSEI